MRAIGDASATLNQLVMAGASHPRAFVSNFVKVLRDSVDDAHYNEWLAGDAVSRNGAGKFVSILGDSGPKSEFQFGSWIERVPVLKQTQAHFTRFGNRMRVDAFNDLVDASERAGRPLDAAAKEAIGRNIDRVTGISASKATDAETLLQFAPNFLRSHIEVIGHAIADGGLEGSLARQYVRNWAAIGTTLVAGVALAQGRDLKEVLTPLDSKALKNGQVRLNPNFGTIRLAGQDIGVFGAYDSLARLAALGVDSTQRAIKEKDASQLFDFVGYAATTKGSPLVSLISDAIKGEDFNGRNPLRDPVSLGERALPFTASGIIDSRQKGESWKDTAAQATLGFFGAKSNPTTLTERLNAAAGGDFWKLDKDQRQAILDAHPDLAKQVANNDASRLKEAQAKLPDVKAVGFENLKNINEQRLANEAKAVEQYKTNHDAKALREGLDNIQADAASRRSQVDTDFQLFKSTGELPKDPEKAALTKYYAAFDAAKPDGVNLDHEKLAEELAKVEKEVGPEMWAKIQSQTGQTEHAPGTEVIYDAKKVIDQKNYWDITDRVWAKYAPTIGSDAKSADAYFGEMNKAVYDRLKQRGYDDYQAGIVTQQVMNKLRGPFDDVVSQVRKAYRESDPELLKALIQAGYYTPGKEAAAIALGAGQ
jgi:hypothetical protein